MRLKRCGSDSATVTQPMEPGTRATCGVALDAANRCAVLLCQCDDLLAHTGGVDDPEGDAVRARRGEEQQKKGPGAPHVRDGRPAMGIFVRRRADMDAELVEAVVERFAQLLVREMRGRDADDDDDRIERQKVADENPGAAIEWASAEPAEREVAKRHQRKDRCQYHRARSVRDQLEARTKAIGQRERKGQVYRLHGFARVCDC
jgi:hypothetical protein